MYRKGPAFDVFLIIICIYLIKPFFLKKDLSIQEMFWIEHSNPLVRNLFVFSVLMEIAYVFLCDIGILQGGVLFVCKRFNVIQRITVIIGNLLFTNEVWP